MMNLDDIPLPNLPKPAPVRVPIRSLSVNHRERIVRHLLALDENDRFLRFGYYANESHVRRYVDSLNFDRDEIFGIYNRKLELIAMAHLAYAKEEGYDQCAEFGASVLAGARGRGYGARLFERAAMHASNDGITMMYIHALSKNDAMLTIARNAGAVVESDGAESEAFLRLPEAYVNSKVAEILEEQMAQTDYRLKVQAKQFRKFLASMHMDLLGISHSEEEKQ
jgi:GNAT superfamily N-acetyltransferase